jgi:serine-type D-Ala-D-Ala carboxypeptidase (penicillin-binding protein 5/6)
VTARRTAALVAALALGCVPARASAATPPPACSPDVNAPSAIVIEVSTQAVACARNAESRRAIASTTKLMTALLTLERAKLDATFRAPAYHASAAESLVGLFPGERMKVRDLLKGLLAQSGNDAAMALADNVAGSERAFVRLMNARARQLGLSDTHFANPIGLDARGNYSTAHDLVRLALVLRTNPFFRKIVDSQQVTLHSGDHPRTFRNRNTLLRDAPWVNGVKTGHTRDAGYVLVGSARRHGVQVISAVLGTNGYAQRDAQSLALLRTGLAAFQYVTAVRMGQHVKGVGRVPIRYRPGAGLALVAGKRIRTIVPHGRRDLVTVQAVQVPQEVAGPIRAGQQVGSALVLRQGKRIATIPLVAAETIPAAGFGQRTKAWLTRPVPLVLVFAVLGGTVLLGRRRRIIRSRRGPQREATPA